MFDSEFLHACAAGDVAAVERYLAADPALVTARDDGSRTGLHHGHRHPDVVRVLLAHGADPNARETGDNATAVPRAAANGASDSLRRLRDAGADVHRRGDLHEGEVIGWAS